MKQLKTALLALVATAALVAAGCGGSSDDSEGSSGNSIDLASIERKISGPSQFRGPNGEKPFVTESLEFTEADLQKLEDGNYTAAVVWHDIDAAIEAEQRGIRDEFERLGIELTAQTDADFDAAQQSDDYAAAIAKDPDVILTLPIDTASAAKALQPAIDRQIPIVIEEILPDGFEYGHDYVSLVATDYTQSAAAAALILGEALGGEGKLAYLPFDIDFFITNQWDASFKETIEKEFPDIEIAVEQGFADSDPAKVADVASPVLAQNPDLDAMYATYQDPLTGVLSALQQAGREGEVLATDVGIDEKVGLEIAECGAVPGVGGASFYDEGVLFAELAAYGILDKKAPPLVISPNFPVVRENLVEAWERGQGEAPPASIQEALEEDC